MTSRRRLLAGLLASLAAVAPLLAGPLAPAASAADCPEHRPTLPDPTADLTVDQTAFTLDAGAAADVHASLALSQRAYPVDLFFVLDASQSMEEFLDDLGANFGRAAENLSTDNIDLQAGVAWYATTPYSMYVLERQLGYVDCHFNEDFPKATTGVNEPILFALRQAVVGDGVDFQQAHVAPGQQARFRAHGLQLVIHATDELYDETDYLSPSFDDVVGAYKAKGVRHVGIYPVDSTHVTDPRTNETDPADVAEQLRGLATATGAIAPAPIDCNGVAGAEVATNEPVVCPYEYGTLGEVFSAASIVETLVEALRPESQLKIQVIDADGLGTAYAGNTRQADLTKAPSSVDDATLTLTCPADATGSQHAPVVAGLVNGEVVAQRTLSVTCGQPLAGPPPPPPPPPPVVEVPGPPPPAAPQAGLPVQTTVTITSPGTATVTHAAPAQASQLAPGAMVVPDEARVEQLALERSGYRSPAQDEVDRPLLASRRRRAPAPVVTWIAGAMLLAAMSVATQRERQRARAWVRR